MSLGCPDGCLATSGAVPELESPFEPCLHLITPQMYIAMRNCALCRFWIMQVQTFYIKLALVLL